MLRDLGLNIKVDYRPSDTIELDKVIEQDPRKLSEVEPGSRVNLVVSQGEEIKIVLMPDVTKMKLTDAKNEITKKGLEVGRVDEQSSEDIEKGRVTWQSYEPGVELESKTVVDLFVSSGPDEESDGDNSNEDSDNNDNGSEGNDVSKEKSLTFTVTPYQDREETAIKVIRIQDGVSEVVHNKTYNVNEGDITLTVTGKLGSKFEIYYDDILQTTLVND